MLEQQFRIRRCSEVAASVFLLHVSCHRCRFLQRLFALYTCLVKCQVHCFSSNHNDNTESNSTRIWCRRVCANQSFVQNCCALIVASASAGKHFLDIACPFPFLLSFSLFSSLLLPFVTVRSSIFVRGFSFCFCLLPYIQCCCAVVQWRGGSSSSVKQ